MRIENMSKKKQYDEPIVMVVDIGGSKYIPGFVDAKGNVLYEERREWKGVDADAIVEQLKAALNDICVKNPQLANMAKAGGLTIPGFADPVTGVWVESDFLMIKDLPICDILSKEFHIPFFADNDCNACALAERYFGGAKEQKDFLYLTVSTGIGGALYLNEELYYGSFWHSGEIGLFVVEEDGRTADTAGVKGVVEMYASGRGLTNNYLESGGLKEIEGRLPGGQEISQLAKQKDEAAVRALKLEGRYLGRTIANACAFADFGKVILGGGLSLMFDQYQEEIFQEFARIWPGRKIEMEATQLGYLGAFLGAAAVAVRGYWGFKGSMGSGSGKENIFRVKITDSVQGQLELEGSKKVNKEADFGGFLAAKNIWDLGKNLNQIVKNSIWEEQISLLTSEDEEVEKVLYDLGRNIGKGVACACILLDPGKVVLEGTVTRNATFQAGFLETMRKETYYRGNFPFEIQQYE